MAKKFVRGVTGIEDIESYDKTLTNVNDILSDGQDTYVHTKKGKNESYYKLTDSVKTINSTGSTITVSKDENGTVNLSTNPKKVLEHDNLLTDYGISKTTSGNTTRLAFDYTKVPDGFDLNNFTNGFIKCYNAINKPIESLWFFVKAYGVGNYTIQDAVTLLDDNNTTFRRYKKNGVWGQWREQVGDKSVINALLAQKQNTLTSNASIGIFGNVLRQLYSSNETYTHSNGVLKTYVKWVSVDNSPTAKADEEFNFIVKINKAQPSATFTLKSNDQTHFSKLMSSYGENNTVRISGCVFTLNGSNLTVSTTNNTAQNYVISFSDILS